MLYEGDLDAAQLDALACDLAACTRLIELRVKGSAESYSATSPGIADAIAALRERRVRAVQIMYEHEGVAWCDTLIARGSTTHLVRSRVPS